MELTDNLVAYWKLDETSSNAADSTGNGKTLTNTNTVAYGTGKINNGADFGTTNTNKVLTIAENLGITGGNISISCWVKLNAEIASGAFTFVKQDNTTTQVNYNITYYYNAGTRRFFFSRLRNSVVEQASVYNTTMGTTNWYHLVLTYNGTNVLGYVNGTATTPVAASGNGSAGGSDTFNVGLWVGTTNPSQAIIDEVGVWNRALSAAEITTLYNGGAGITYPFITDSSNFFQLFN